jgi:hypothetical protein
MRISRTVRLALIPITAIMLPAAALVGAGAQEETPTVDTSLTLPQGERTRVAISRAELSDDDPPIDGRGGIFYASNAPLLVLHEGSSRVERVLQGKAVTGSSTERRSAPDTTRSGRTRTVTASATTTSTGSMGRSRDRATPTATV